MPSPEQDRDCRLRRRGTRGADIVYDLGKSEHAVGRANEVQCRSSAASERQLNGPKNANPLGSSHLTMSCPDVTLAVPGPTAFAKATAVRRSFNGGGKDQAYARRDPGLRTCQRVRGVRLQADQR